MSAPTTDVDDELPPLADTDEPDEQPDLTPSARQRAQRRLPLNQRRGWSTVITGQVLDMVAVEAGQRPTRPGRGRGLAALIPDPSVTPAEAPRRPAAARTPPPVAPRPTPPAPEPAAWVDPQCANPRPHPGHSWGFLTGAPRACPGIPDPTGAPPDPPDPTPVEPPEPPDPPAVRGRPWPGDGDAISRLHDRDAGWALLSELPGWHRLDADHLDITQLDQATRHHTIDASSGTVLLTRCGLISPHADLIDTRTATDPTRTTNRCPTCEET